MDEVFEILSQESNFMDLTISPPVNNFSPVKNLDRPPRNFGKVNDLRSVQELPEKYRCIFEFPYFNIIQSNVLDDVLYSDESIVISAPTGSGKTVVFEVAIIKLLMDFEEINYNGPFNIIYVAPLKSLCYERLSEWHSKFSKIAVSTIVCTGDNDNIDIRSLKNFNIIITTPEKWDSISRNSKDEEVINNVKLFLIDEVHLLNEECRGPNLEVIVSRMKILKKHEHMRFLAVSATIPNIEDIAEWLGKEKTATYFKIGEELRPVKLNKVVLGYPYVTGTSPFKFDLNLNYKMQNVLMQYSEGKPTLIFCSTRKSVDTLANYLSQNLTIQLSPIQQTALRAAAKCVSGAALARALERGVGAHHAGMGLEERHATEQVFREGHLPLLVATATLAAGVNLPAHTVVLKGTMQYCNGGFQEYSESTILQMTGRAGRPQFDKRANVVIMTTLQQKQKYEKMLGGTELIESNLHRHLTEHLNAEIALGTITDIAIALEWLRYTFLYIRVLKNPKHYNIPINFTKTQIERRLQDWCQIEINALHKYGMLQIDQTDGFSVLPTSTGILMANYYLAFNTMKIFTEIKGTESLSELLVLISKCPEFSESYLRVNDKKTLNTLNKNRYQQTIRFPMKGAIKTTPMKIYCLIQATFGCIRIQNPALHQESIKIMRIGERIAKCLVTFLLHKNKYFSALLNALILYQCFVAKIWENSPYVARQFPKIGPVLSGMLVSAGKTSFKSMLETSPRDIERIINRAPPMGNDIIDAVMHLPFYKINLEGYENDKYKLKITVNLLNAEDIIKNCTTGSNSYMTLLAGDSENNILSCKKLFHHSMAACKNYVEIVDVILRNDHNIQVYLTSENWVGIDCKENYDIIIKNEQIQPKNISFPNNNSKQKEITSFFTPAKKTNEIKNTNNPKTPKKQLKTIDTYFQNAKKFVPPLKNVPGAQNISENITQNIQNIAPENEIPEPAEIQNSVPEIPTRSEEIEHTDFSENFSDLPNNFNSTLGTLKNYIQPNIESNISTHNDNYLEHYNFENLEHNNFENFEHNNFENLEHNITFDANTQDNNKFCQNLDNSLNFGEFTKPKHPYFELFKKHVPNVEDNRRKLELPKTNNKYMSSQSDFESFSQNLARKFSQNSENSIHSQYVHENRKNIENIYPSDINSTLENNCSNNINSTVKKIENNIKIKSILKKFEHTSPKKINGNKPLFRKMPQIKNMPSKKFNNSQNREKNYSNSQITISQNYSQSKIPSSQNVSITNEELEKFKRFIENKNKETCQVNPNSTQNSTEIYPMQYCKSVYTENFENSFQNYKENSICDNNITIDNSLPENDISEHNTSGNIKNITEENCGNGKTNMEKPYFPKKFREYVQNSIDNLKKNTLVNKHFNYDIGSFQEFLMGPLDNPESSSDEENSGPARNFEKSPDQTQIFENTEQNFENQNYDITFDISNTLNAEKYQFLNETTPENSFTSPEIKISDVDNITFSCSGQIFTEKNSQLDLTLDNYENFNKSPEISFLASSENFQQTSPVQNSESSEEFSEKATLKVENRMKIIEQYYDSPKFTAKNFQDNTEILPVKRQKLSNPVPLYTINNNKQGFNNSLRKNDPFKKMSSLNNIMSKYGNKHENKITLNKNNDEKFIDEPVINEIVKKTAYSYSVNKEKQSVEMSVTIYEKEIEKTKNKSENENKNNIFRPFSRY